MEHATYLWWKIHAGHCHGHWFRIGVLNFGQEFEDISTCVAEMYSLSTKFGS
jgi:hypothetical protein